MSEKPSNHEPGTRALKPSGDPRQTPAMQQYYRFKKRHPDCVLLFRMGDFYETFDDDAVTISKALGLTLTQRTTGVPMAGVPYHQLETYLKRLVAAGFRVAVGEQLQDAAQAKGLVPRAVTRVVTPGTLVDESLLEADASSGLAAVCFTQNGEDSPASLAIAEVSTGQLVLADAGAGSIGDELARYGVRELLYADGGDGKQPARVKRLVDGLRLSATPRPAWQFRADEAREAVLGHFRVGTLAGFGLRDDDPALPAAGALIRYLRETQTLAEEDVKGVAGLPGVMLARATLAHLRPPRRDTPERICAVDAVSLRALEVEQTLRAGAGGTAVDGSLLGIFLGGRSACRTAMGKRLLRDWLRRPLRDIAGIEARQGVVGALAGEQRLLQEVQRGLDPIHDVARIAGRLALGRAGPRDLAGLARSLERAGALRDLCAAPPSLARLGERFAAASEACSQIATTILGACVEEPPPHLRDGGLIRDGFDRELDEARSLQRDAGTWLAEYQARLIEQFALPSLRVGFNRVFGYYIELPSAQARQAPAELIRSQTLKNAERFTSTELREFERKVTSAESSALERERAIFQGLCEQAVATLDAIGAYADAVGELDALQAFADKASRRGWVRPLLVEEPVLDIRAGRHPVLDELTSAQFVPNGVRLGKDHAALALITGPNMAGKSTFIRQTALLVLLAHTGSFVPAEAATIGLTDRIFTRIGADDALHAGQSTFMVEMIETANILHHATARSLIVLDEIGRGTSTLDGLSLAWAIAEHLSGMGASHGVGAANAQPGPRTLFATHYHELTELEERLAGRVQNLHVAVKEWPPGDPHAQIIFLHRIVPGKTDQSYGVQVARLAGIPTGVITRAREVLSSLAVHHGPGANAAANVPDRGRGARESADAQDGQLSLFTKYVGHPALDALRELKLEGLSPLQAFDRLRELRDLAGRE